MPIEGPSPFDGFDSGTRAIPASREIPGSVFSDTRFEPPTRGGGSSNIFYHKNPCRVSNDPNDADVLLVNGFCNITAYLCTDDTPPYNLTVPFDYDLIHTPEADLLETVPFLEVSMLEYVAAGMSVQQCPAVIPNPAASRRLQEAFSVDQKRRFLGVSLEPRDMVDERYEDCYHTEWEEGYDCTPMQGGMTMSLRSEVTEEELPGIREAAIAFIRSGMDKNLFVVPGRIQDTLFVGDRAMLESVSRTVVSEPVAPAPVSNVPSDDDMETAKIAGSLGAVLAAILIATALLISRRRRGGREVRKERALLASMDEGDNATAEDTFDQKRGMQDLEEGSLIDAVVMDGSLAGSDSLAILPQAKYYDNDSLTDSYVTGGALAAADSLALEPQRRPTTALTPRRATKGEISYFEPEQQDASRPIDTSFPMQHYGFPDDPESNFSFLEATTDEGSYTYSYEGVPISPTQVQYGRARSGDFVNRLDRNGELVRNESITMKRVARLQSCQPSNTDSSKSLQSKSSARGILGARSQESLEDSEASTEPSLRRAWSSFDSTDSSESNLARRDLQMG